MILSNSEQLALAVLRGDESAIGPLLDELAPLYARSGTRVLPTRTFALESNNVRIVMYAVDDPNIEFDEDSIQRDLKNWLAGKPEQALCLSGIARMEVYQLPEASE